MLLQINKENAFGKKNVEESRLIELISLRITGPSCWHLLDHDFKMIRFAR